MVNRASGIGRYIKPLRALKLNSMGVLVRVPVTVAIPTAQVVVVPVNRDAPSFSLVAIGVVAVGRVLAVDRRVKVMHSCWLVSEVSW
jgi:hypothetical protein